ncbi:DUF4238 domain-containing protein [Nocardia brasiliensis]|uniref:DUF4238 domain-containing protein n=1 Tax=Nocardia brasiliensis TaxID=37326 RepID=UPI002455EB91|nr:DUF4238 domain-containing protein [Nocardia brasiliensis]
MDDMRRWLTDAEIAESKRIAANDQAKKTRHHFVPQMYLRRWLIEGNSNVQYRDVDQGRTGFGSPKSVAFQDNFYNYNAPNAPELWVETHLSRVESDAAVLLKELDNLPDGRITDQVVIDNIAIYVGLQGQRTPRVRTVNDAIETRNPSGKDPQTAAIDMAVYTWRAVVFRNFSARTAWLVSSAAPLVTCDEPVAYHGYPNWTRKKRLSLATAALVLFPLGPHRMLVLAADNKHIRVAEPFQLGTEEASAINLEIAANCLQFVFEQQNTRIARELPIPSGTAPTVGSDPNIYVATNLDTRWAAVEQSPRWPLTRWIHSTPDMQEMWQMIIQIQSN